MTISPILQPTATPQPAPEDASTSSFRYRTAYEKLRAEIEQIPETALEALNIEVRAAVLTAIGANAEVQALVPMMDATFRTYEREAIVELEPRARAAAYAHQLFQASAAPVERIPEYVAKLTEIRNLNLPEVRILVNRKLINGEELSKLAVGPISHRDLGFDSMLLAGVLRKNWSAVQGKTPITLEELATMEQLADELLGALAMREQGPAAATEAGRMRQKAWTHFIRAYSEARRTIEYLRFHEGDVESIIPSLYAGRGGRGKKEGEEIVAKPAAPPATGAAPAPAPEKPAVGAGFADEDALEKKP